MVSSSSNKEGTMKRIGILIASFLLLGTVIMQGTAAAASRAIGVNPRRDYTLSPGETKSDTIFVTNLNQTEELTAKIEIIDFGSQNQTGSPALLLKATEPTKWSLKPYLSMPDGYKIPAGKSAEIPFTISIPEGLGAGSYYSAIRFMADSANEGSNVSLTSSAATLMFIRVTGETRSSLTLEKLGAFTPNKDMTDGVYGTFFSATAPKYLSYLLKNNGNVAEQPTGSLLIRNIFGKQVQVIENANPGKNLVLIDQIRRIDVCLNEERKDVKNPETGNMVEEVICNPAKLMPGIYKAQLGLVYGDSGNASQEIKATATFWYLPVWFIIAAALGIALLAFAIWKLVHNIKNYKKPTYGTRRR